MDIILLIVGSYGLFLLAYHTYGKWLSRKIFQLRDDNPTPAHTQCDNIDYCPTPKMVVFGHHYTSIAGTGPIVGPAIAVFWGWLPALLWILLGSILIGAVHDFSTLVISLRNRGQTIGEIAGQLISRRARLLFLLVLLFALSVVLGIFGLVIATIFSMYPESVLSIWCQIPLAMFLGFWIYRKKKPYLIPSLLAIGILYILIYEGRHWPIQLGLPLYPDPHGSPFLSSVMVWTIILFIYCYFASTLPVWLLLQPRDFINSFQLFVALGLLILGIIVAGITGHASLLDTVPAITTHLPSDALPIFPFLFITVACGAVSGFHSLVSSGTSSKQLNRESDALLVGYGGMLMEGVLGIAVLVACTAGIGMGTFQPSDENQSKVNQYIHSSPAIVKNESSLSRSEQWKKFYSGSWNKMSGLNQTIKAFVEGSANFLYQLGIPFRLGTAIMAVLVACFAGTTIDSATRIQRYVIEELGKAMNIRLLTNKYIATFVAVGLGLGIAMIPGKMGPGSGGLILWPIFGAINQLLAAFAFLVVLAYLWWTRRPTWFIILPFLFMVIMPAWALILNMKSWLQFWQQHHSWQHLLLTGIGMVTFILLGWLIVETLLLKNKLQQQNINTFLNNSP